MMKRYKYKEAYNQYNELIRLINGREMFTPTKDEILRNQDILSLAEERGYIAHVTLPHDTHYKVLGDMNDFKYWLIVRKKEEKLLCVKEWALVLVGAIAGAIFTNLPEIINFFTLIFNNDK